VLSMAQPSPALEARWSEATEKTEVHLGYECYSVAKETAGQYREAVSCLRQRTYRERLMARARAGSSAGPRYLEGAAEVESTRDRPSGSSRRIQFRAPDPTRFHVLQATLRDFFELA
jgi:hypothetical protein